ncbi:N(5)-(carboxyethyl)ornithine synthase [Clostridium botulinum]|uniref:N(5)-(carboxyethyl)ornithine synthase n=1 Tax=Clostridium botulinum TaxID=1491 RepID=UPI00217DB0AF|nr:N(5)-(carboxyethyl)ornithine synthase [Clostridium botulinum]MCS6104931.1 N(5)-(carboxyethyl)ornithine synthase [Clostridium botulinum]MCS6108280.1 N(5)-(carboxyethyl)ornithine synthase [Clostridium botulinum]
MKTIGFLISTKENEKRRALLPEHITLIKNKDYLYFEEGYGKDIGHCDEEYRNAGAHVVSRAEVMSKDILCDPKIGDSNYLSELKDGQIIFGWTHAVQNKSITDRILNKKLTAIAWEDMYEDGRHVFWRNNELAGEAAIMHAFTLYGKVPYECRVALIGRGNIARGAYKALSSLGANVTSYDKRTEKLLRKEIDQYDVVVNGILWDIYRTDHIIYKDDLSKMKKPSIIIDISCDRAGGIETSIPTTIENPVYTVDGVMHYVVDHTPALISYSVTRALGDELIKYIDYIIEEKVETNEILKNATIIKNGLILDKRIIDFQKR